MTQSWIDLKNTDCAFVIGSNYVENHPVSAMWVTEAKKKRGAKIICVDPRFTRSASKADIYAPLRPGTDIAFIGGMIKYIVDNELYNKEYVKSYTNAAFIVADEFDFNDGLFSGYDAEGRKYDKASWTYKLDEEGNILKDETLQHPRSVFQMMRKHYERYDVDTVCDTTGTPKELFIEICDTFAATAPFNKSGVIMYAMGTTQHTVGAQNVRSYGMLQLLLANVGVPGGGVDALRGESNVQGSTDYGMLFHILPGYVGTPQAFEKNATLAAYNENETPKTGYWANKPKFLVSFLKAMWNDKATKENDFFYNYLPKRDPKKNYSHIALFEAMYKGDIKGMFLWGQNPLVGGPNTNKTRVALANLDWMVAIDLWTTETMTFWSEKAGSNPAEVNTEVFVLPACSSFEKEGSVSNSGRWAQWRWKGVAPVGDSRPDLDIVHELALRLKDAYANSTDPKDGPIRDLFWDYGPIDHPDIEKVVKEINGWDVTTGQQLPGFAKLMDDGTTLCGNWIYSGCYPEEGKNNKKRRVLEDKGDLGLFLNWSFAWPANRRILYNRASADPTGKPWSEDKKIIWWDETEAKWVGYDVPDFLGTKAPSDPGGADPFIMREDGRAWLFSKGGMNEGPFPEHYEPWEAPMQNKFSSIQLNPVVKVWEPDKQSSFEEYPYVATTYRMTEHWQTGGMTRSLPWQNELVPEMFVEIGKELADEKGIMPGDYVVVENTRGQVQAKALVTERFQALTIDGGRKVHQVGLPWHFGHEGMKSGDVANKLTPHVGDGNTMIPEYKAFLVNIKKGVLK